MVNHGPIAGAAIALEEARPALDAAEFEILEIDGRTVWPHERGSDRMAFYIGRKGTPTWDATKWVEVLIPHASVDTVRDAILNGIELAKARL